MKRWLLGGRSPPPPSTGRPRSTPPWPSWSIERAKRLVESGQGRRHRARRHHPPGPGLQPGRAHGGPHHGRRHRHRRPVPAEEVLRRRPQRRGGRLAHHPRHRPGGDQHPHGRGHLRGVQGHREHGAQARPAPRRAPDLPGHRRRRLLHPPRGAAVRPARSSSRSTSCAGSWRASRTRPGPTPPGSRCSPSASPRSRPTPRSWPRSPRAEPAPIRRPSPGGSAAWPPPRGIRPLLYHLEATTTTRHTGATMKADIHPDYVVTQVKCSCGNTFTTHSTQAVDLGRALQRVPPLLHRQAEAGRHRRPHRPVRAPLRPA